MNTHRAPALPEETIAALAFRLSAENIIFSRPEAALAFFKSIRTKLATAQKLYSALSTSVTGLRHLTQEVEWILDNFYILEGALTDIKNSARKQEFLKLPQVASRGSFLPRIYAILIKLLETTGNTIDKSVLHTFISTYQQRAPLALRELSETPGILKIILIERMQELITQLLRSFEEIEEARQWTKKIIQITERGHGGSFAPIISQLASRYPIVPIHFGFHLLQRLSAYGGRVRPVLKWLRLNLMKLGVDIHNLAEIESRERSRRSQLIANIVDSLRWLNQTRWDDFIDEINIIDKTLRKDPANLYVLLDARSRMLYRKAVVRLADRMSIHEVEVAKQAVKAALPTARPLTERSRLRPPSPASEQRSHVGYYLIGEGRLSFEEKIGYQPWLRQRLYRFLLRHSATIYLGSIAAITLLLTGGLVRIVFGDAAQSILAALVTLLLLITSSDIAVTFINALFTNTLPVRNLPKLDFAQGIPSAYRTFVVVPSLLTSSQAVAELLRRLEVNYLGNRDPNIFFALLLGFPDAPTETLPTDSALLQAAQNGIAALNNRYGEKAKRFFLFHRQRIYNPSEGVFMEWERKRGKLREFNRLLRGHEKTSFVISAEEIRRLPQVRYVITLDEDTRLPRDSAKQLIGCLSHPLHQASYDHRTKKVINGYGIIQPRVSLPLAVANRSWFSRLFSFATGIDPYATTIADIYQDLFGEGIFFGKGIYDVDIVEAAMGELIPDNTVLSHDLLEGMYARTGLATDIQVFDDYPFRYHEYLTRLHRWIRGDWQIISWLKATLKTRFAKKVRNTFTAIDRWKIFDNLRRSLIPITLTALLITTWLARLPHNRLLASYAVFVLAAPFIIPLIFPFFKGVNGPKFKQRLKLFFIGLGQAIAQTLLRCTFLLAQAAVTLDAIIRAGVRITITRTHLLQWRISREVSQRLTGSVAEFYKMMWPTQLVALLLGTYFILAAQLDKPAVAWTALWLLAPLVGYLVSVPRETGPTFSARGQKLLRTIAVKTIRYFLELAGSEHNWLIPDHLQEEPKARDRAATTSPTNLGVLLTSLLNAHDFGYLGLESFELRLKNTLKSLGQLERFKGHLYNWYDIQSLEPLSPKYVSSVDSANFLASLLALKQGVQAMLQKPLLTNQIVLGLKDMLASIIEDCNEALIKKRHPKEIKRSIKTIIAGAQHAHYRLRRSEPKTNAASFQTVLQELHTTGEAFKNIVTQTPSLQGTETVFDILFWIDHFEATLADHKKTIATLLGFSATSARSPAVQQPDLQALVQEIVQLTNLIPSLTELTAKGLSEKIAAANYNEHIEETSGTELEKGQVRAWLKVLTNEIKSCEQAATKISRSYEQAMKVCEQFFTEADFAFLYNKERGLFHIGYNATFNKIDNAYYDFLASEANTISLVAIIKNQIPQKHWFYLGRKLLKTEGGAVLASWGGSLFEYLTSLLLVKTHPKSIVGQSAAAAIKTHRLYARAKRIPWGMGESAHRSLDINQNYQYQIFGVPEMGLKRGLNEYLVVAPYTTALALQFSPRHAIRNLVRLIREHALGRYGLYDAIDYTDERNTYRRRRQGIPVRVHYAHHQGFIMAALSNALSGGQMQALFHADPRVATIETLLEEKMPLTIPPKPLIPTRELPADEKTEPSLEDNARQFVPVRTEYPRYAFLSNGSYTVGISNAGSGWSNCQGIQLTRFRNDPILETSGQFIYLRDENGRSLWSPTLQPTKLPGKKHRIVFSENKAEFQQTINSIESQLTISVAEDENAELRQLTLTNRSLKNRTLEVASYGEASLATANQDLHHPAFQKLLVASEFVPAFRALILSRPHPQDRTAKALLLHQLVGVSKDGSVRAETNRELFLGRQQELANPLFFKNRATEADKNFTLDPIISLSTKLTLAPGEAATLTFITAYADTREEVSRLMKKYRKAKAVSAAIEKSSQPSASMAKKLGASMRQALTLQELGSRLLGGPEINPSPLSHQIQTTSLIHALWRHGISGNVPIMIVRVHEIENLSFVKQALLSQQYLFHKGLRFDLVILNEHPASYIKTLHDEIDFLIRHEKGSNTAGQGEVFHLKSDLMSASDKQALLHAAKIILDSKQSLEEQLRRGRRVKGRAPEKLLWFGKNPPLKKQLAMINPSLAFPNGLGGFDESQSEYVLTLNPGQATPMPWANILANNNFGTLITESGSSFTWSIDSYDNRLTSWHNDPIRDGSSEIIYLRDENTNEVWGATPSPIKSLRPYIIKHGKGYSVFSHERRAISHDLTVFVAPSDPVKIFRLQLQNHDSIVRKLSVTGFFELALGVHREHTKHYLSTNRDHKTGALFTQNAFRNNFSSAIAFIDIGSPDSHFTNDRGEFLGRGGSYHAPAGLKNTQLSDLIKNGADHCAALQRFIELAPQETKEIIILLGEAQNLTEAHQLIARYQNPKEVSSALAQVKAEWQELNQKVQIQTPDKSLNLLVNDWLLYQAAASRLRAKTGYYQPSGAYGFRDVLQDAMAFVWSAPGLAKEIILKAASRQFLEGDAQGWWHEHNGFGIRSVFSDHQAWLPYVVTHYANVSNDLKILSERLPFLESPIPDFEDHPEWAGVPTITTQTETLYEHCVRAIEKTLTFGKHGLPLIGKSDWNDGLSNAGVRGRGESIWLGWFMCTVLRDFIPLCEARHDSVRARHYQSVRETLMANLERYGWDGAWYKRAYLDNGLALGSAANDEFRIDSIAQSWSVLSDAGKPERRSRALQSVRENLLTSGEAIKLLAPALLNSQLDPGYVKDYPPGVRENGSQYNHAALWLAQAFALEGDSATAYELVCLVNPILRSKDQKSLAQYRVEPYVVASDIYTEPSYPGRGGWTWYSGSASLLYRTILETLLGLRIKFGKLSLEPRVPKQWEVFTITYHFGKTTYLITVNNPARAYQEVAEFRLDGKIIAEKEIELVSDAKTHTLTILLG